MHRQKSAELEVHDAVDVTNALKYKPVSLYPVATRHPGGQTECDASVATTTSRPMLVAAASHAVLFKIGFRLLMDPQFVLPASLI